LTQPLQSGEDKIEPELEAAYVVVEFVLLGVLGEVWELAALDQPHR
jgi:hypothetical protein